MAYKLIKSCANCKFYIPNDSIIFIGDCSFHNIITNIILSCYNYESSTNIVDINGVETDCPQYNNKSCGICEIQFFDVSVIGFNEFLKENKYKIRLVDSCNNCKYYKYVENNALKGFCNNNDNTEVDILHLCENHINVPQRVYILHPIEKSEWI